MSFLRVNSLFPSAVATLLLLAAASVLAARIPSTKIPRFADAENSLLTTRGAHIYEHECGPCHGRHLQGQPFWQLVDQDTGRRAPALDQTGRAWRRSDEDLFHIVEFGRYAERPEAYASHMPAFRGLLGDRDILAVLAYVKARWPIGQRALQAPRNPEPRGMPAGAETTDWRLAATCFGREAPAVSRTAQAR